ncbi:MAG: hypothetical protein WD851_13265 [Pirellulales bacterium]
MKNWFSLFAMAVGLAACAACGSGELPIDGQVLVDGAPMESGTVRFDPVDLEGGTGAGGMVEAGVLQLPEDHGLSAGKYRVTATAFKKTGKVIQDYQRGQVDEMVQLPLSDSPQEIDLTADAAGDLVIKFTTSQKK